MYRHARAGSFLFLRTECRNLMLENCSIVSYEPKPPKYIYFNKTKAATLLSIEICAIYCKSNWIWFLRHLKTPTIDEQILKIEKIWRFFFFDKLTHRQLKSQIGETISYQFWTWQYHSRPKTATNIAPIWASNILIDIVQKWNGFYGHCGKTLFWHLITSTALGSQQLYRKIFWIDLNMERIIFTQHLKFCAFSFTSAK